MDIILDKIMEKVIPIDPADATFLRQEAERKLGKGWSESDIIAFLKLTEEVNPDIEEAVALRRMEALEVKYKGK